MSAVFCLYLRKTLPPPFDAVRPLVPPFAEFPGLSRPPSSALLRLQGPMRRLLGCGAFLTAAVAVHLAPSTPRLLHRASIGPAVRRHASSRITTLAAPAAAVEEAAAQRVHLPTNEESDELLRIRHTSAHVMAMAVQRLFKDAKVTIGPWIEKGFYYDFELPQDAQLEEKDLKKIKKEMDKIIQRKLPLVREEVPRLRLHRRGRVAHRPRGCTRR